MITDPINDNQTLIPNSVVVGYGYSTNGKAVINGEVKDATISTNNN